jgi:hypothetical protein
MLLASRVRLKAAWVLSGGIAVLAAGGVAAAQSALAPPATADAQVGFKRPAQLSPQQELAEADNTIALMSQGSKTVSKMLEDARAARDVVKTLCLNDKLSQMDVAIRSAKDRKAALVVAAGRSDQELSNHEFTILTVLRQRHDQLTAEANQCIGQESAFLGATNVSFSVDNTLPPTEDAVYPLPIVAGGDGPPTSSSVTGR